MTEAIAVIIAFAASFCENYSTYMQKKAMNALPRLSLRLSWTVLRAFFTNRSWLAAMVMEGVGVSLYMVALIFLPVSIVEPIITAGIALVNNASNNAKPTCFVFIVFSFCRGSLNTPAS